MDLERLREIKASHLEDLKKLEEGLEKFEEALKLIEKEAKTLCLKDIGRVVTTKYTEGPSVILIDFKGDLCLHNLLTLEKTEVSKDGICNPYTEGDRLGVKEKIDYVDNFLTERVIV